MMIRPPDLWTLQLCSELASLAFAGVFLWLWHGQRGQHHYVHWAASLLIYVAAIAGFSVVPRPVPLPLNLLLLAGIVGSNAFFVSGVRLFEGLRPFAWWMLAPVAVTLVGATAPALFAAPPMAGRLLSTAGLALGEIVYGGAMLFGPGSTRGQRVAGLSLLAYLPGYAASMLAEAGAGPSANILAAVMLLLDQVLLLAANIGLLAMPGERATRALTAHALGDALTGARNRAWLLDRDARLARAGTAVVLIDIDHFKAVNDGHGHAAGDAVLAALATRLLALADGADGDVVRLGGDEFLAILPAASEAHAAAFAESARHAAIGRPVGTPAWTTSIGIAFVEPGEAALAPALGRADRALYRAKLAGRDRVAA